VTSPNNKDRTQSSGCLSTAAGCLVASLIFPFSITFAFWFAFALGPMNCALPNRCSKVAETAKGILSIVILVGGGFGIPLTVGSFVNKAVKMNAGNYSKPREDSQSHDD
jgi:hypothetical protein